MIKTFYKLTSLIVFMISTLIILSGCSILDNKISDFNEDIPKWEINKDDATQIINDSKVYQVLKDQIEENKIGKVIGRIGKISILDKEYQIINQRTLNVSNIFDSGIDIDEQSEYIVPFQNVYEIRDKENSDMVIVDVNGKYHIAISIDKKNQSDVAIEFEKIYLKFSNSFKLNKENYNQLLSGDKIYIITDEEVGLEDLDFLLDSINKTKVIDIKTGREIEKSESTKIEIIPDKLSSQERKQIEFGDVYSIKSIEIEEFVAIKINEEYRLAKSIK